MCLNIFIDQWWVQLNLIKFIYFLQSVVHSFKMTHQCFVFSCTHHCSIAVPGPCLMQVEDIKEEWSLFQWYKERRGHRNGNRPTWRHLWQSCSADIEATGLQQGHTNKHACLGQHEHNPITGSMPSIMEGQSFFLYFKQMPNNESLCPYHWRPWAWQL